MRAVPPIPPRRGSELSAPAASTGAFGEAAAIGERVAELRRRIDRAADRAGRDPRGVTLIGASKGQPADRIRAAFAAGVAVFGESRVQEALGKMPALPEAIEWHFIGPLQTNKARAVTQSFAVVHSIDRRRLAEALDREAARLERVLPCLLEVNLAGEATKHGFSAGELAAEIPRIVALENLDCRGLMAIPPAAADPEDARHWFRALAELRDRVGSASGRDFPGWLSMGMSDDFEIAVEEGATHVRIGTALFGPRAGAGEAPSMAR